MKSDTGLKRILSWGRETEIWLQFAVRVMRWGAARVYRNMLCVSARVYTHELVGVGVKRGISRTRIAKVAQLREQKVLDRTVHNALWLTHMDAPTAQWKRTLPTLTGWVSGFWLGQGVLNDESSRKDLHADPFPFECREVELPATMSNSRRRTQGAVAAEPCEKLSSRSWNPHSISTRQSSLELAKTMFFRGKPNR